MVIIDFLGELAEYVGKKRIDLPLKTPIRLRDILTTFITSLEKPYKNLLLTNDKLRAIVIVNGVVETNYDRIIVNNDKVALLMPIEGG